MKTGRSSSDKQCDATSWKAGIRPDSFNTDVSYTFAATETYFFADQLLHTQDLSRSITSLHVTSSIQRDPVLSARFHARLLQKAD
jgi:hypothetical protein